MLDGLHFNILLVDDDDVAVEAVERSLRKIGLAANITNADDGADALDILRGVHPKHKLPRPYVVLLDLNMPRMNGFEFLQEMRADPELHNTVVFVLTTSDRDTDRTRAYHENIAGYMVKSSVGPQFSKLAQLLMNYHNTVALP
jgi:CheY-like chemotaxis protein